MPPPDQPAGSASLNAITARKWALARATFLRLSLTLFCAGAIAHNSFAGATTGLDNPYKLISARNVFRLRPPISASPPAPQSTLPLSTIVLTGITTVLGAKRVFLEITPPPKPPHPA